MSTIRKKGIITTIFIYIGFALGALNIFLYSKYFNPDQVGLTRVVLDIAVLLSSFALLGTNTIVTKFYPYYKNYHGEKPSELLTISFVFSIIGFLILFISCSTFLKPLIIRKYSANSPMLVEYFYIVFPLTLFLTLFQVLEAQTWNIQKAPASNFLKEVVFRGLNTLLNLLFIGGLLSFTLYVDMFSLQYFAIFIILLIYMAWSKDLKMSFKISKLTQRLWRKMLPYSLFIFGGNVITMLSTTLDGIIISSFMGLTYTAVFMINQYIATLIVVPYRGAVGMAAPMIAKAWREKDMWKLASLYRKTSLNLLIAAAFIFCLLLLNYDDVFALAKPNPVYKLGKPVLVALGLYQVIELGTGMNSSIIINSRRWKFELYSNIILLTLTLPVTYILIKTHGMVGAAIATLISRTIFNAIRWAFLYKVFNLQPFNYQTLIAVLIPLVVYPLVHYTINVDHPLVNMVLRTGIFSIIYGVLLLQLKVSEDVTQVYETVKKRLMGIVRR